MCVSSVSAVFPLRLAMEELTSEETINEESLQTHLPSLSLQLETCLETPGDDFMSGRSQNYLIFQGSLIVITIQALSQQVFRKCLCL